MEIQKTFIEGVYIIKADVYNDERGFFYESYNEKRYSDIGLNARFVQDNVSFSKKGTIRGLHYQLNPFSQAKLVHVLRGAVLDVVVDLREDSPTYGKHFSIELTRENKLQLFVPRGMAHGFSVLSDEALFSYKCDNTYDKNSERGINVFDPVLAIDWRVSREDAVVSDKDLVLPEFELIKNQELLKQ